MSVSRVEIADTRRQLRPVRTEAELAADLLVRLFDLGLLRFEPRTVAKVADGIGVSVQALRDAKRRYDSRGYLAPDGDAAAITVVPAATSNGHGFHDEDTARAYAQGTARGQRAGAAARSRQPVADAPTMRCSRCGHDKPIGEFSLRSDRPGRRWTVCDGCRRTAQRDRYLSVGKRQAMNAARVTFTIGPADEIVGLSCMDCDWPLAVGDDVYGEASLHHVDCARARDRARSS